MIFAIYSKGRFDKEARGLGVGDVFAIDRYTSKHKALEPLAQGGALFVVTVRPGDKLWLVAVLEEPKFEGGAWVAANNCVPIVDITQLVKKIQFSSGKGIKAGKGKLGMSLQTPRELSLDDVAMLRAAAGGAAPTKASATAADPAPAPAPNADQMDESLARVAKHLGDGWRVDGGHLRHQASGAAFAYVPGGWLRMGFSLDDIYDACRARRRQPYGENSDWPGEIAGSRPAHMVEVTPFVIAVERHPLDGDSFAADFRHPSEAELEWLFRRGGRDRWVGIPGDKPFRANTRDKLVADIDPPFGIALQYDGDYEYCADAWHPNYEGAPSTSEPWGQGAEVFKMLHTAWQDDDEEMICIHAAYRQGPGTAKKTWRPTLPLPEYRHDRAGKDAPAATESRLLMAALGSDDKAERKWAQWTLELVAAAPADDVAAPLAHVIANLSGDARALRQSLRWLGNVTMGEQPHKPDTHANLRASLRQSLPAPGRSKAWQELAALLEHDDKKVRAAAVPVITAACLAAKKGAALAERLKSETDKVVAAAIVIGLALLGEKAADTGDAKLERALAKVRVLADALRGEMDAMAVATALDVTGMAQLPWFDGKLDDMGMDLLRALPTEERERVALALVDDKHRAFELVFDTLPSGRLDDPAARLRRLRKLRLDELTPAQVTVLERFGPGNGGGFLAWRGLPDGEIGYAIMFGRSQAQWSKPVRAPGGSLPAYYALSDMRAQAVVDGVDEETQQARVIERLSDWTLHDMLALGHEASGDGELWRSVGPMHAERAALNIWPFFDRGDQIKLIKAVSKHKRAAFRITELKRLRDHLRAAAEPSWPETMNPLHLALSLEPGEKFPADGLAAISPEQTWAFNNLRGHHPLPFPEPQLDAWLCKHMQVHIERAIAGKKPLAGMEDLWLSYVLSPEWSTASVLTIIAYEMSDDLSPGRGYSQSYKRVIETPVLSAHHAAIPDIMHQRDERGGHPQPRAALKALWEAAQAARRTS